MADDTQEKPAASERNTEVSESSAQSQEREATDRLREDANIASAPQASAGELNRQTRPSQNGAVEHSQGQVTALSFDNSIYNNEQASGKDVTLAFQNASSEINVKSITNQPHAITAAPETAQKDAQKDAASSHASTTTDAHGNTTHTDANGNTTVTSFDGRQITYTGADGRGYIRTITDNGYEEVRFGPNARDNYNVRRENNPNGGYSDHYSFSDSARNHRRDVTADGRVTVTDAAGVKIHFRGGSAEFQERVLNTYLDLPLGDRERLQRLGASVIIADQVKDFYKHPLRPEVQGLYDHRGTRAIIIGANDGRGQAVTDPEWLLRHEVGHAIDHSYGALLSRDSLNSRLREFQRSLSDDVRNLGPDWEAVYSRYLRNPFHSEYGHAELFADIYAALNTPNPTALQQRLIGHFPQVTALIRLRLRQLRGS